MAIVCERCGIGRRDPPGACDWCAAPVRPHLPLWLALRRWLMRTWPAREARRGGAVATGVTAGVLLHLVVAAVAVAFRLPDLWRSGFLWSQQWWWALVPEAWQPWLFSALVGIAYGALAGLVIVHEGTRRGTKEDGPEVRPEPLLTPFVPVRVPSWTSEHEPEPWLEAPSPLETGRLSERSARAHARVRARFPPPSPATVTALVAFIVTGWDPDARAQDRLIAALIGAAIGRLTTLVWRGRTPQGG